MPNLETANMAAKSMSSDSEALPDFLIHHLACSRGVLIFMSKNAFMIHIPRSLPAAMYACNTNKALPTSTWWANISGRARASRAIVTPRASDWEPRVLATRYMA